MKLARVARMLADARAFDLETHKIQPGLLSPPVVCGSVARWNQQTGRSEGKLLSLDEARDVFMQLLDDDEHVTIVGANIAFDMLCMAVDFAARGIDVVPQIFAAYEAGRVWDLQIAEALHAIARGHLGLDPRTGAKLRDPITRKMGRYSLSICLDLVLHRVDAKVNDKFRMSYALLEDTPMASWPLEAQVYPVDDACNTLDVALAQAGLIVRPSDHIWTDELDAPCEACGCPLSESSACKCPDRRWQSLNAHDVSRQAYAAFAMHLGAAWGFSVDPDAVDALEQRVLTSRAAAIEVFVGTGHLRYKKEKGELKVCKTTGVIKRGVALAYGASGACSWCAGTGKVTSSKSDKPVGCRMCDSTGLGLDSAPVPRTKGSKCRTCSGKREYAASKPKSKSAALNAPEVGTVIACKQCEGQPDVVPGCGTGRDALYESGDDDVLIPFAEYLLEAKILETYLPFLRKGMSDDGEVEVDFDQDENDAGGDE